MVLPGDFFRPDYFYQFGTGFSGAANGKGWDIALGPLRSKKTGNRSFGWHLRNGHIRHKNVPSRETFHPILVQSISLCQKSNCTLQQSDFVFGQIEQVIDDAIDLGFSLGDFGS